MNRRDLSTRHRVENGSEFSLKDVAACGADELGIEQDEAKPLLAEYLSEVRRLQTTLHAERKRAVLIILQSMDVCSTKRVIEDLRGGVDPRHSDVKSFDQPHPFECRSDFLWQYVIGMPDRGGILSLEQSYYDELIISRAHPETPPGQHSRGRYVGEDTWRERTNSIEAFERLLVQNGTAVLKFHLHVFRDEQNRRRVLQLINEPGRAREFLNSELEAQEAWDRRVEALEDVIRGTAQTHAPWFVVPSDNKWYARLVVSAVLAETLERLGPRFPEVDDATRKKMKKARASFAREAGDPRT